MGLTGKRFALSHFLKLEQLEIPVARVAGDRLPRCIELWSRLQELSQPDASPRWLGPHNSRETSPLPVITHSAHYLTEPSIGLRCAQGGPLRPTVRDTLQDLGDDGFCVGLLLVAARNRTAGSGFGSLQI